jgi:predicted GH43/DUF377 family glycosyl hydrolase
MKNNNWKKLGLIYRPEGKLLWNKTHGALPVAINLREDIYRILFATRNDDNISSIASVDLDINNPQEIIKESKKPLIISGPQGFFDDRGALPSCIVKIKNDLYLYYSGWNSGKTDPIFYPSIGLAISKDNGNTFKKYSDAPIMSRGEFDPCFSVSPFVIKEGKCWKMWYVSCFKWEKRIDKWQSLYHIKYAESKDGICWRPTGKICIPLKKGETNIARPCVVKDNGLYKMWYSYEKGKGYRIGYAESKDGLNWIRKDDSIKIDLSQKGWDCQMMAYPYVIKHKNNFYMFYNGNNYGEDGFGIAKLVI